MKKYLSICILLFVCIHCFAQKPDSIVYKNYCNGRFFYCIDYPKGILMPQPESENGDGRVFKNNKGKTILTVYGIINQDFNGDPILLKTQFENDIKSIKQKKSASVKITYQKLGNTFYVISGYRNGNIFYQKTFLADGNFCYAILEYPITEKLIYDKVSVRIFKSFK